MSKQLEALEKQKQQINARIQQAKAVERAKERKKDLRRKVLIGEYYLVKAKDDGNIGALYAEISSNVKREVDRELFSSINDY